MDADGCQRLQEGEDSLPVAVKTREGERRRAGEGGGKREMRGGERGREEEREGGRAGGREESKGERREDRE